MAYLLGEYYSCLYLFNLTCILNGNRFFRLTEYLLL